MKKPKHSLWAILYKFHRYTGLSVAIIILMLSITGIALNHTGDLKLDKKFVKSPAILDWYGIDSPTLQSSFAIQTHWLSQLEEQIYLDTKPIFKTKKNLIGATINADFITIAFTDALLLLTLEGETIEQIDKGTIQKIGADQNHNIYIKSQETIYYSDDGLLTWQLSEHPPQRWSNPSPLPTNLQNTIQQSSRHTILPYERVILDIHSGRFFGRYGVYIIDLAGVLFILLAISGTWIWLKHKFKRKRKY